MRLDYPQILSDDTPGNKEYVEAYAVGENLVCFKGTPDKEQYNGAACEANCKTKYEACENDLDSYLTKAYYNSARIFHKLGVWSFSATWIIEDTLVAGMNKVVEVGQAIKKGFSELYDRMADMETSFHQWLNQNIGKSDGRVKREASRRDSSQISENWHQFLIFYNSTDPILVDNVYESLNYTQFCHSINVLNEALSTYDFGPGEWIDSGSTKNRGAFSQIWYLYLTALFWACALD